MKCLSQSCLYRINGGFVLHLDIFICQLASIICFLNRDKFLDVLEIDTYINFCYPSKYVLVPSSERAMLGCCFLAPYIMYAPYIIYKRVNLMFSENEHENEHEN